MAFQAPAHSHGGPFAGTARWARRPHGVRGARCLSIPAIALACAIAPSAAHANPPDPLVPLLLQVEGLLRRNETKGVTLDSRYALNPAEVTRLSVVAQLLGYADLHAATPNPEYRRAVISRADFLVARLAEITNGSAFDGMLGYALLQAHELSGDARHLGPAAAIVQRLKTLGGSQVTLNWGMMAAMCLARYHALTGDAVALQKTRSIVASLRGSVNSDGSFPHYCARTRDVHYTGWLAMELTIVRRYVADPTIDELLADINGFLRARVGPTGETTYANCGVACSGDADGDGVCEELDRCVGTPAGCAVDTVGCATDDDLDGVCDQGCFYDADLDRVCDRFDLCPETPQGCVPDRFGCETDRDGDGACDVNRIPPCHQFWSLGSGCGIDYDTRGWVNELGYSALVFDWFREPAYYAVMGFLYRLTNHGAVPDKWGYPPLPTDAVYRWGIEPESVIRTSVVFWSLAAMHVTRSVRPPARYAAPVPLLPIAAAELRALAAQGSAGMTPGPAALDGLMAVDRLVLGSASPDAADHSRPVDMGPGAPGFGRPAMRDEGSESGRATITLSSIASPAWPGNNVASLRYDLTAAADVSMAIFDVSGRRILERSLGALTQGAHELRWDCRDGSGRRVPAGLYWVQIRADSRPALTERWFIPR